jgi:uncharacterized protein (TIGR00730 family)
MNKLRSITVYCGSRPGSNPLYMQHAYALGRAIAERGAKLVYGGAQVGLMGEVARGALDASGHVMGVIPIWLADKEISHTGLTELHVVETMHVRKNRMAESDAFIAMPGGFGTLEEVAEMITWAQIGLHQKPIGLLDIEGYFAPITAFAERAARDGFMAKEHLQLWVKGETAGELLEGLESFQAPPQGDPAMDRRFIKVQ